MEGTYLDEWIRANHENNEIKSTTKILTCTVYEL